MPTFLLWDVSLWTAASGTLVGTLFLRTILAVSTVEGAQYLVEGEDYNFSSLHFLIQPLENMKVDSSDTKV